MKRLLIVYHTQFGGTAQMANAAFDGARFDRGASDTVLRRAADADVGQFLAADALLIATVENFGGMAGMVKDFLERVYYPCEGRLEGRPYAAIVCAGTDGTGAVRDVERVATGLRLRRVHPGRRLSAGRHVTLTQVRSCPQRRSTRVQRARRDDGGRTGGRPLVKFGAGAELERGSLTAMPCVQAPAAPRQAGCRPFPSRFRHRAASQRQASTHGRSHALDQPGARDLHQVEHAVESVEPAVIGVGHLARPASGAKSRNRPRWPAYCGGRSGLECTQVRPVHRDDPAEASKSSRRDLPRAQRGEVVAAPAAACDRAPVRRVADVPVAGAGRVDADPPPLLLRHRGPEHASAVGDRQMLPRQTNRTERAGAVSMPDHGRRSIRRRPHYRRSPMDARVRPAIIRATPDPGPSHADTGNPR